MNRLDVPYSEKDEAKALGARWNQDIKSWTINADQDTSKFEKWLPKTPEYSIRADSFSIVRGQTQCWKCHQSTEVFGIRIESGTDLVDGQQEQIDGAMLAFVEHLSGDHEAKIKDATDGRLYRDRSKTVDSSYLMNHCQHCGVKQGDYGLHQEPGAVFYDQQGLVVMETIYDVLEAQAQVSQASTNSEVEL